MYPTPPRAEFTDKGKFYHTDKGRLPSVSTVLEALTELKNGGPPFALKKWRENEIKAGRDPLAASIRGKEVHSFAELFSYGEVPKVTAEIEPYTKQLEPLLNKLYNQYGHPTHREHYVEGRWYGGQFDQGALKLVGPSVLADIKTIGKPKKEDYPDTFDVELSKFNRKIQMWKEGSHDAAQKAFKQLSGYAGAWGEANQIRAMILLVIAVTPDEAFVLDKTVGVKSCIREWDSYEPLYHRAIEARAQRKLEQERKAQESALEEAARVSRMMETF